MIPLIQHRRQALDALCRRYRVRRLDVFGSAAQSDTDADANDVDLLVEFAPDCDLGPWMKHYFDLRDQLQALFDRPVDLVLPGSMHNPYFIREVNRTRKPLYAA